MGAGIGLQLLEGGNVLHQGADGAKDGQDAGEETFHMRRMSGFQAFSTAV